MSARAFGGSQESLRQQLLRGALSDKVDLGSWISVDAYLIGAGVPADDLNCLTDDDLDEVRQRLQRRATPLEQFDAAAEAIEESGFGPLAMALAIGLGLLAVQHLLCQPAKAAELHGIGTAPSSLAGLLVALVPVLIAVLLMAAATRGTPQPADEEAFGDTTGFGEQER